MEEFLTSLVLHVQLVLLVATHLALFSFWRRQAQNALHVGRYGPQGLLRHGAHRPDCKLWSIRSCSPSLVVDISFAVQRQSLMVQTVRQTIDILQSRYKVVDVPVCRSCRFPCRQLQFFDMVIDAPVVQVCRFPVPSRWRQSSSHSCHC